MRIRKRHPPWPLSSLLPAPLPDPHLPPPPPVQLHGRRAAPPRGSSPPPLHLNLRHPTPDQPAGSLPSHRRHSDPVNRRSPDLLSAPIDRGGHGGELKAKEDQEQRVGEEEDKLGREGEKRDNDFGEANMFGGAISEVFAALEESGGMAVSLKKRTRSLLQGRLMPHAGDTAAGKAGEWEDGDGDGDSEGKKRKKKMGGRERRGAVMEGSRCSRVNGRGWRCCQPTLVGYSLCDHHLGKGRLRSIAAVRIRAAPAGYNAAAASGAVAAPGEGSGGCGVDDEGAGVERRGGAEDDEEKPAMRIGAVKARSLSSLLGGPHGREIAVAAEDENDGRSC